MPRKKRTYDLIRSSFADDEWNALCTNQEFVAAVERADTAKEADNVIAIGCKVLGRKLRLGGKRPDQWGSKP